MIDHEELRAWLKTRPRAVQELAKRFPIGSKVLHQDETMYIVGYKEDGSLLISPHNLESEYDLAVKNGQPVCAACVSKLEQDRRRLKRSV